MAFGNFSELLHRPRYTRPRFTAARLQRASSSPIGTTCFTFSALPSGSKEFNMASSSRKTTHSLEESPLLADGTPRDEVCRENPHLLEHGVAGIDVLQLRRNAHASQQRRCRDVVDPSVRWQCCVASTEQR